MNKLSISDAGLSLIKDFEKCVLKAYKPTPEDVWTCGWGSTKGVTESTVWTEKEADEHLRRDLAEAERCVNASVFVDLTQLEFDALVSLVFNIGCGAFRGSTLLRLLNDSRHDDAAQQFKRWNKQAGKELAGLTRRREAEMALFERSVA